ncbi:hypothetical protein VNN36_09080 [Lactococcus garvieae]|uniref:hypothetical protein n=1 Tax=Lactococcus garvieae TaxID=1363 RepID=UPI0030D15CCF
MSEQKYYVEDLLTGDGTWVGKDIFGVVSGCHMKPTAFTKSELAEIMDGALYKQFPSFPFSGFYGRDKELNDKYNWSYNFELECWEWKNPLIELVPVEEDE